MCTKKEFPIANQRLTEWAEWNRGGGIARELDLPSQAAHLNSPGGSFNSMTGNEHAEQIDKLVARLTRLWPVCGEYVETYYKEGLNISGCSQYIGVSRKKFEIYFQRGMGWLEANLNNA